MRARALPEVFSAAIAALQVGAQIRSAMPGRARGRARAARSRPQAGGAPRSRPRGIPRTAPRGILGLVLSPTSALFRSWKVAQIEDLNELAQIDAWFGPNR